MLCTHENANNWSGLLKFEVGCAMLCGRAEEGPSSDHWCYRPFLYVNHISWNEIRDCTLNVACGIYSRSLRSSFVPSVEGIQSDHLTVVHRASN